MESLLATVQLPIPTVLVLILWSIVSSIISYKLFRLLWGPTPPLVDYGEHRRRLAYTPAFEVPTDVEHTTEFVKNSRGSLLHAQRFAPTGKKVRGVIFLCAGYADTVSWLPTDRAVRFAQAGFVVYGLDYEGAGLSDGLHVYIPCFETMVDDVQAHYRAMREKHVGLKAFLVGESMGGAVAIKLALRDRGTRVFDGCILLAPMVKIAESMKPPDVVINSLKGLVPLFPTLPVVPSPQVIDKAFRRPEIRELARSNPFVYKRKPRLATALQLLEATESVNRQMELFDAPVLVLQGTADTVTDPGLAQEFYTRVGSKDKELRLYDGFWHSLISGELPENVEKVYVDIFEWLDRRTVETGNRRSSRSR